MLKKRRRISENEGKYYSWQILNGLSYIHQQGVLHRDIKPANLFLDANMRVKIADFGLAERLRPDGSSTRRTFCGTPSFIAPEVIRKRGGHTAESDVWAVGITMYMLLVGRPPFEGSSTDATYRRILRATTLIWPSGGHLGVSDAAKDVVQLMLQHEPTQRITVARCKGHVFFQGRPEQLPASAQFSCPPGLKDRPGTADGSGSRKVIKHHDREPKHALVPPSVAAPRIGHGSGSGGSSKSSSGDSGGARESSEGSSQEDPVSGNRDSSGSGSSADRRSGPRAAVRPWVSGASASGDTSSSGEASAGGGGVGMGSGAPMSMANIRAGGRPPRWQLRHGGNRLIPPPPTTSAAAAAAANSCNLFQGGVAVRCGVRSSAMPSRAQQHQRPATSHGEDGRRRHVMHQSTDDASGRGGAAGHSHTHRLADAGLSTSLVIDHSANGDRVVTTKYMVRSADAAVPLSYSSTAAHTQGPTASVSNTALERRRQLQQQQAHTEQHSLRRQPLYGGSGNGSGGPNMQSERPRRPSTAGPAVQLSGGGTSSTSAAVTARTTMETGHGQRKGHNAQPLIGAPTALLGHSSLVRGGGGAGGNRTLGATTGALRERLMHRGAPGNGSSRPMHGVVLAGRVGPGMRGTGPGPSGAWLVPSQTSLLAASSD